MRHYPSARKQAQSLSNAMKRTLDANAKPALFELPFLVEVQDDAPARKALDEWRNEVANTNINNSIMQWSAYAQERLGYAECAQLFTDTIINKAIMTIAKDCIGKRGVFHIKDKIDGETENEIISELESNLDSLDFWRKEKILIERSLTFGGAFLFLDSNTEDYSDEYRARFEFVKAAPIRDLKIIEPWLVAPYEVNTANPLNRDYMRPNKWHVSGAGAVHSSRFLPLVFFEATDLYKPIFNFLGVSLTQFMKDYVKNAETIRQALADLFLRFRTQIIKSGLLTTNAQEALDRATANNKMMNNLGVLLLTENEEWIESITPIAGLDKIQAQAYENLAVSARMPAVKLLGLTPSGFNATGDFDLKNYYDEIQGYQNGVLKPQILKVAQMVLWGLGYNYTLDFEFTPIAQESAREAAERENLLADKIAKLIQNQIIEPEQAFTIAQDDGLIPQNQSFSDEIDEPSEEETEALNNEILQNFEE